MMGLGLISPACGDEPEGHQLDIQIARGMTITAVVGVEKELSERLA